jgi:hypothetical protein
MYMQWAKKDELINALHKSKTNKLQHGTKKNCASLY